MQKRHKAAAGWARFQRRLLLLNRASVAPIALFLVVAVARAQSPVNPSTQQSDSELNTITVQAERDRAILERRVNTFVSSVTIAPYQESLAQWKKEMPICPQVAGLPYLDGEYVLTRFSQIAEAAGACHGWTR
jgi:hypothetical protein